MLAKPEIACAIIEGISSVREDEELQDFVVEVEGKEFKCHRLILSACSGFFRGLLRSGMKEKQKQRTKLDGVSTETFAAILEILYTGRDNLTRDNMLIWETSSQLMYTNIIERCEQFLINNTSLENWNIIYATSKKLGSELILSHARDFIKKNYEQVIKSKSFLCLHENDLLEIIKSQDLVVSTEDVVVWSILYWVNNGSQIASETIAGSLNDNASSFLSKEKAEEDERINNGGNIAIKTRYSKEYRKEFLGSLLSETRLCLVNSYDLEKLSHDPLVMENDRARQIVMDAALSKSAVYQHGQWSKSA
ncbi:unnamed protein product, partial [Lymnaea stagnalis]